MALAMGMHQEALTWVGAEGGSTVLLADRGMILIDLLIEFESLGEPSPESHQLSSWPMKKSFAIFFL